MYEDARLLFKNPDGPPPKAKAKSAPKAAKKPASKAVPAKAKAPSKAATKGKQRKVKEEDEEEDEDEDENEVEPSPLPKTRPRSRRGAKADDEALDTHSTAAPEAAKGKARAPASRTRNPPKDDANDAPAPRRTSGRRGAKPEPEVAAADAETADPVPEVGGVAKPDSADTDELAEIDGIRPKVVIKDGEEIEAKSQTRYAAPPLQFVIHVMMTGNLQQCRVQSKENVGPLLLVCHSAYLGPSSCSH